MAKVVIGADVCPTGASLPSFREGNASAIFDDLLEEFQRADLSVVNLECPLTDQNTPIRKHGPVLGAPSVCIETLKNAKIDVLSLANNHILDHGVTGLESTLRAAEAAGIATVGAGRNLAEARRILIKTVAGVRVGILGLAEHEFSITTTSAPGASPLDIIDVIRNITAQRECIDYLIVLLHGGNEGYPYPSPRLMDTCRFLVEQGAGAVICQHSHCAGCYETYHGGHIVYGQGNLIFHYSSASGDRGWTEGFLVRLSIDGHRAEREIVPFVQSRGEIGARKMDALNCRSFLSELSERSERIQDEEFVQQRWQQFCAERRNYYLSTVLGHNRILRRLNRNGRLVKLLYSSSALLGLENIVRCEAHREVLEAVLKASNQ